MFLKLNLLLSETKLINLINYLCTDFFLLSKIFDFYISKYEKSRSTKSTKKIYNYEFSVIEFALINFCETKICFTKINEISFHLM